MSYNSISGEKLLKTSFSLYPNSAIGGSFTQTKSVKVVSVTQPIGETISRETVYKPTLS